MGLSRLQIQHGDRYSSIGIHLIRPGNGFLGGRGNKTALLNIFQQSLHGAVIQIDLVQGIVDAHIPEIFRGNIGEISQLLLQTFHRYITGHKHLLLTDILLGIIMVNSYAYLSLVAIRVHIAIYQEIHGTCLFYTDDLDLMVLVELPHIQRIAGTEAEYFGELAGGPMEGVQFSSLHKGCNIRIGIGNHICVIRANTYTKTAFAYVHIVHIQQLLSISVEIQQHDTGAGVAHTVKLRYIEILRVFCLIH